MMMIQATIVDRHVLQLVKIQLRLDLLDRLLVFQQLHHLSFDHYDERTIIIEEKKNDYVDLETG